MATTVDAAPVAAAAAASTLRATPRSPAPRLFYTPVHDKNINSVKLLVQTVLPVRYSDNFYKQLILSPPDFTKMGALHASSEAEERSNSRSWTAGHHCQPVMR